MIARRFVPIVCALLGLALVPTLIHSYADFTIRDGRVTSSIPTSLAGYDSVPSTRNETWGKRRFGSDDWTERVYRSKNDEVKLTLIRSYDAKSLYHHPELAVAYGPNYVSSEVRRFPQRPEIPVHVLSTATSGGTVALYVLHYSDRFVEDPIRFQIRASGELLFSARQEMTLFFATDAHAASRDSIDRLPAAGLLFAAIDEFLSPKSSRR